MSLSKLSKYVKPHASFNWSQCEEILKPTQRRESRDLYRADW